jgi:hypothetical protein
MTKEQALDTIWARLSGIGSTPGEGAFCDALYVAVDQAKGTDSPAEAQTSNPEGRLKEYLNPYFGQPHFANQGQVFGGSHPQFLVENIDWSIVGALAAGILKFLRPAPAETKMVTVVSSIGPEFDGWARTPTEAELAAVEAVAGNQLPGYPPR